MTMRHTLQRGRHCASCPKTRRLPGHEVRNGQPWAHLSGTILPDGDLPLTKGVFPMTIPVNPGDDPLPPIPPLDPDPPTKEPDLPRPPDVEPLPDPDEPDEPEKPTMARSF